MKCEAGFTLIESLLGMMIVSLIITTIVPGYIITQNNMRMRYEALQATHVALDGIKRFYYEQQEEGHQVIEGTTYRWQVVEAGICVYYHEQSKCTTL